ncbi:PRC-barrel domain-containing protein [Pseudooceanicola sp. LIPI14-2-Ac024]|uniref:PRC-barrel domain-containing protein n=1 Tax=Pseudooceanicola sp. LIPI14-2-Ac024 TaxID=3344875 RepID=UPI0035CEDC5E
MKFRTLAICAAVAAGPALAQSTDLRDPEDIRVVDGSGTRMGEVEGVLVDGTGMPAAFVVDFDRRVGLDPDERAVPIADMSFDGRVYVLDLTPDALSALPVWDD